MNLELLRDRLEAMAALPGMRGCALVDGATGMVWLSAGDAEQLPLAEAATDYWRLCQRQEAFAGLGRVRAQIVIHEHARVTLVRCGEGLLLVTLSHEPDAVDWKRWKHATARIEVAIGT